MGCFNQTITYNDAAFRALFPNFSNTSTYPELLIQAYWDTASLYINPNYYKTIAGFTLAQQTQALNLMTAHLVYLFNLINTNQTPGIVTAATIDKISVTLQPPPEVNQWQWWLNQSPYGQQLLALLQVVSVGGFYVSGAPPGRAGFRFSGVW